MGGLGACTGEHRAVGYLLRRVVSFCSKPSIYHALVCSIRWRGGNEVGKHIFGGREENVCEVPSALQFPEQADAETCRALGRIVRAVLS